MGKSVLLAQMDQFIKLQNLSVFIVPSKCNITLLRSNANQLNDFSYYLPNLFIIFYLILYKWEISRNHLFENKINYKYFTSINYK
jgi:hypothetical protein